MKKTIITTVLSLGLIGFGKAQDAAKDFASTAAAYSNAKSLNMQVAVKQYASTTDQAGTLIGKGEMHLQDDNYYSSFLNDVVVKKPGHLLHIDKSEHVMHVYRGEQSKGNATADAASLPDMSAFLNQPGVEISYQGSSDGAKHYRIESQQSMTPRTDLWLDAKTGFIKRIDYYYAASTEEYSFDAYKVRVDYTSVTTSTPSRRYFDLTQYYKQRGGTVVPEADFAAYRVITH